MATQIRWNNSCVCLCAIEAVCIAMSSPWATWYCILAVDVYLSSVSASNTSCPTWFYSSNTTHQCECGRNMPDEVYCNQQEMKVEIADGYCVTSTEQEGLYYAGFCPFRHTENNTDRKFSELPSDPDLLNDTMCGPYNRKNLLCGSCIDGYGPAVYSRDMKCANCSKFSTGFAISVYLLLEFIPTTLFFMGIVLFRLNITAGPLLGYVLLCQVYMYSIQSYLFIVMYIVSHVSVPLQTLFYSSVTLSGLWSLQIFRFVIPPFCISENLTTIHVQMLNLVTSIYPIVLVVVTCILMELHARNCRLIHIVWKPFSITLDKLKVTSVTRDAVIHAFATFILLTAYSLYYNAYTFVRSITLHLNLNTDDGTYNVLYFDPTIIWFSQEHIPYILAAVVPFVFLVLIPSLLLCVYPTKIYRYLSWFVSARKRLAITAFAEALHSCFKDGLNGTRDYRALAGVLILLGAVLNAIAISISNYVFKGYSIEFILGLELVSLSLIFSYVRPCKSTIANLSLSYHAMMIGILSITLHLWQHDLSTGTETLMETFIIIPVISHVLVLMWAMYTLINRIMSHFGYPSDCRVALTDLANAVKWYFQRKHGSYQVLPDTAS